MAAEISYVLITPYSLMKSRTGGIIARLLSRCDLDFIGAQMLAFNQTQSEKMAESIYQSEHDSSEMAANLLADYVRKNFAPRRDGRPERVLMLLFQGEDACRKLSGVCGRLIHQDPVRDHAGESIRDTYADVVEDKEHPGKVVYFEPAVFTPPNVRSAKMLLSVLAEVSASNNNILTDYVGKQDNFERTMVIIKPENWRYASSRPGNVIDMLSRTGLVIAGCKVYRMSVAEALDFYGPVKNALRGKVGPRLGECGANELISHMNLIVDDATRNDLCRLIGQVAADDQFGRIVEFMSGRRPEFCSGDDLTKPGLAKCMVIVYEGVDAIRKIRDVLGPTDPSKAPAGTVRRDFGSDVMVNTAHASDSPESVTRELKIIKMESNSMRKKILDYLANE